MRLFRMFSIALVCLLAAGLVLTTTGCGSGDATTVTDSAGPAPETLSGTYFWQAFFGFAGPPVDDVAQWGTIVGDGAGMLTGGMLTHNQGGAVSGPNPISDVPFTVDADNRITLNTSFTMQGGVSPGGSVCAFTSTGNGSPPLLAILRRQGSGFSTASLNGLYHVCAFFFNGTVDGAWWAGTAQFDGNGTVPAFSTGLNLGGAATNPGNPVAGGTYTVGADGTVSWAIPGAAPLVLTGGICEGGELVVLAGNGLAANTQALVVLIPKGTGLSNATFDGTYHATFLAANNAAPPPRYAVQTRTITADGAGSFTVGAGIQNQDGATSASPGGPGATTYQVNADGTIGFQATALIGGVAPSGNVAVLAGTANAGMPFFAFLHR